MWSVQPSAVKLSESYKYIVDGPTHLEMPLMYMFWHFWQFSYTDWNCKIDGTAHFEIDGPQLSWFLWFFVHGGCSVLMSDPSPPLHLKIEESIFLFLKLNNISKEPLCASTPVIAWLEALWVWVVHSSDTIHDIWRTFWGIFFKLCTNIHN